MVNENQFSNPNHLSLKDNDVMATCFSPKKVMVVRPRLVLLIALSEIICEYSSMVEHLASTQKMLIRVQLLA